MDRTKIQTITPSDKVNFAIAKWSRSMIGLMDLESVIMEAVCDGELAPSVRPDFLIGWSAHLYGCWHRVTDHLALDAIEAGLDPTMIDWDEVRR